MSAKRIAFRMAVNPDAHAEYARRHQPIWPELEATLREHGVVSYSIFLDETTSQLFAFAEIESEERWAAIAVTEVCQRWWAHMKDVMPTELDNRPISHQLTEVFRLDPTEDGPR